jgi:hypothetical protein
MKKLLFSILFLMISSPFCYSANSDVSRVSGWSNRGSSTVLTNSSGSVGIGTTAPSSILTITNIGAGDSLLVEDSPSPDASPFVISATGNVGIGTTIPRARFDVGGNITTGVIGTPVAFVTDLFDGISGMEMGNRSTGTAADFRFMISDTTGHYMAFMQPGINNNVGNLFGLNRYAGDFILTNAGTLRTLAIGAIGASDVIFGTTNLERMRILSTGNVGIGTTTPGYGLEVNGTFQADNYYSGDGSIGVTTTGPTACVVTSIKNGIITAATCT